MTHAFSETVCSASCSLAAVGADRGGHRGKYVSIPAARRQQRRRRHPVPAGPGAVPRVRRRARIVVFALGIAGGRLLLWRFRDHHHGDFGALGRRGARSIITPALDPYVMAIATVKDPDRPVRDSVAWYRIRVEALFGPVILVLVRSVHWPSAARCIFARDPEILWAFLPTYAAGFLFHPRLRRVHRAGRRVPGRNRGRSALRRHRAFRARADPKPHGSAWCFRPSRSTTSARARWCWPIPPTAANPFFRLYPDWAPIPIVVLATAATVIASQAVITGAYSLTRQAIQLGLLPRMEIRHTSARVEPGQIYHAAE